MTKARTLADMISDGVIGTTELADDVITPVKLDETGNYTVAQLDVNGTLKASTGSSGATAASNADDFVVEAGGDGGISILTPSTNTGTLFFGDNTASNAGQIKYSHSAGSFSFVTEQNTRMTIDNIGNVGIGVTPSVKFHVKDTFSALSFEHSGGNAVLKIDGGNGDLSGTDYSSIVDTGGALLFGTGGGIERMRVRSDGNIHINTTTPDLVGNTTSLSIGGSSFGGDGMLSLQSGWGGTTYGRVFASGGTLKIGNPQSGSVELYTANLTRLEIDSSGRVTMPYQPAFKAGRLSNYTAGAGSDIVFDNDNNYGNFNIGGYYSTSNGRFTAPVAGRYLFYAQVIYGPNTPNGQAFDDAFSFYKNGSRVGFSARRAEYVDGTTGNSGYYVDHGSLLQNLSANDYITINNRFNVQIHGNPTYCIFYGYLLG